MINKRKQEGYQDLCQKIPLGESNDKMQMRISDKNPTKKMPLKSRLIEKKMNSGYRCLEWDQI